MDIKIKEERVIMGTVGKVVAAFIGVLVIIFIFELIGLGMFGFFAPKWADAERKVFEETESYVHGKAQDLQKRYGEWIMAESEFDKTAIENLIRMEFAEFDSQDLKNEELKKFLKAVLSHQRYSQPTSTY